MNRISVLIIAAFLISFGEAQAYKWVGESANTSSGKISAGCNAPTSATDLNINNARVRLLNAGDMWWDFSNARYEIPKGSGVHSFFVAGVWVGGMDEGGNLRLAAVRYRTGGVDWYAGPLTANASIDGETCDAWDRHFSVTQEEINDFVQDYDQNGKIDDPIPTSIQLWPGKGNKALESSINSSTDYDLAPFNDRNGNGMYEPSAGDHPVFEQNSDAKPDQMVWWVINDKGNIHGETNGAQIGLEVQNTAFAFKTNDEINDMTFYRYTLINKSNFVLDSTHISINVDADLGNPFDDYVGTDTVNDLGIIYNGDNNDETTQVPGYSTELGYIPMAGVDYFQGPIDGETGERLGMSSFIYYINALSGPESDPQVAPQYYNYMTGTNKEGDPFLDPNGNPTNYMFTGSPDNPSAWSECSAGNTPADRRFLQTSGPFKLLPGDRNEIIIGVVWVPDVNYPCPSFDKLIDADKKAQTLFDSGFELLEGPPAPDLAIRELDQELILSLGNTKEIEEFDEVDISQLGDMQAVNATDTTYTFEGYRIFQLKRPTVSISELNNPDQAREIRQVDVKNNADVLVNFEETPFGVVDPIIKVTGENAGLAHTFRITKDAFGSGGVSGLINHKKYYFTVLSYAYNNYKQYDPADSLPGQTIQYLEGSKNVKIYTAIPHKLTEAGVDFQSQFGDGVEIIRLEGKGNGGFYLRLAEKSIPSILANTSNINMEITYAEQFGPVEVKITDPFVLKENDYQLYLKDVLEYRNDSSGQIVTLNEGDLLSAGLNKEATVEVQTDLSSEILDDGTVVTEGAAIIEMTNGPAFNAGDLITVTTTTGENFEIIAEKDLLELQGWILTDANGNRITTHERIASTDYEQIVVDTINAATGEVEQLGFTIKVGFAEQPGENAVNDNGFIGAEKIYEESFNAWLDGVKDQEEEDKRNWIRAGRYDSDSNAMGLYDDYDGVDTIAAYEEVLEGTWAPYRLANMQSYGPNNEVLLAPAWNDTMTMQNIQLEDINSIDVVFTSDKSKWTRVVVVETGPNASLNEGNAKKMNLREHASMDKDGNFDSSTKGYSWFPGYALNLETGHRLNMMFGENSRLAGQNGRDMIWNPTSQTEDDLGASVYGGGHYIYVMSTEYDQAQTIHDLLITQTDADKRAVYSNVMWVSVPLTITDQSLLPIGSGIIPTETTVEIRVAKPYEEYTVEGRNNSQPLYEFSTKGLGPVEVSAERRENALDSIRVVPNPYYAFSTYETSNIDNVVKITNLPKIATITIYTIDGTLVRRIERGITTDTHKGGDEITNATEWDLKNQKNIPIASGMYLIHVNAPGIGETIVKWMGVMRPVDLDRF